MEKGIGFKSGKLHYAWIIAFSGMLISGAGVGILNGTLGIFIKPVCEALGFSRGPFTLYFAITMLVSVVLMPFFGTLFKQIGFRRIAIVSSVVYGFTLMGFSVSSKLWHFYALAFINGLFVNGVGIMAVGILVNKWFVDRKGLATGIAYCGSGLLASLLIPVSTRFIELNGWRWTYRFLAFVALFIFIPVILLIIKDKPEDIGLEPYRINRGKDAGVNPNDNLQTGFTRNEAFHKASFWFLAVAVLGIALCQAGPHVHTLSFLTDIGYSTAFASIVTSTYMIFLTISKVIMGFVFDRLGSLKGSLLIGSCCVLFPIFAMLAGFPAALWAYALTLGIASSGSTILGSVLTADYFGRKDYSRVFSITQMFTYVGVTVSSPSLGAIYDLSGSYSPAWVIIILIGIVECSCLLAAYRLSSKTSPVNYVDSLHV